MFINVSQENEKIINSPDHRKQAMDSLIIYFLPTILALGIITSYEDIKEGKIRNKYICTAFSLGIIIHFILLYSGIIDLRYAGISFVFVIISIIIGVLIWLMNWWGAGDTKLFITYNLLIPITQYNNLSTPIHSVELITNMIIPIFLFLVIYLFIKSTKKHKSIAMKKTFNIKNLIVVLLLVFSISWIIHEIFQYFSIPQNYLLNLLLIILIYRGFERIFEDKIIYLFIILSVVRLFLRYDQLITETFLINFFVLTAGYLLASTFLQHLGDFYKDPVKIDNLKEGFILAETIAEDGSRSSGRIMKKVAFLVADSGGLCKEEVFELKKRYKQGRLKFETVMIRQKIRLAPFMFLGVLVTVLCQGNLLVFIKNLIGG